MFSTIIQILLVLLFLMSGLPKFSSKQSFNKSYGYRGWFRTFTAIIEVVIAILLIIGIWNNQLAAIGGILTIVVMIGAIFTHIKIKDKIKNIIFPILVLIFGVIVLSPNYNALLG